MKNENAQNVVFIHGHSPFCHAILQWNKILATCQEMMKVAECMENDSMHKKASMSQVSQFTMKVSIGSMVQIASGPKRGQ
jgi:hypothetical protein